MSSKLSYLRAVNKNGATFVTAKQLKQSENFVGDVLEN